MATEDALVEWGTAHTPAAAQLVSDAFMLEICWGHFPPVRSDCWSTCMAPSYAGPCL